MVLVNQFHGNFRSKTLSFRKIKYVFSDVKWCFNASWGLKGLTIRRSVNISIILALKHFILSPYKYYIWLRTLPGVTTKL